MGVGTVADVVTLATVLLWTNGGPGASSLFGLMTELGPFSLSSESLRTDAFKASGVPTLFRNPSSWSKLGSLLILNGPPPVSFSYCDPPGMNGTGFECGKWNDTSTAKANYQFLESFYRAFPSFKSNELFLTGESYAGIVREPWHVARQCALRFDVAAATCRGHRL